MGRVAATLCLIVLLCACDVRGDAEACSSGTKPKILSDPTGTFTSLDYPSNYPNNADCQWLIVAQPNQVVVIDFTVFDTERRADTIWFFDGNSTMSPVIFGLDGTYTPAPTAISSSQRFLYVWFSSDSSTNAAGFSAIYGSTEPAQIENACSPVSRPVVLHAYNGAYSLFSSAYYPDPYPLQAECQWLLVSHDVDGVIQLNFTIFITQADDDWVAVYDGDSTSAPILERISGQPVPAPSGIRSTQQNLLVRFSSDSTLSFRGFRATYTSVKKSSAED